MKKLLGIVVLGLLLSGNAYAASITDHIKVGMSKKQVEEITYNWAYGHDSWEHIEEFNEFLKAGERLHIAFGLSCDYGSGDDTRRYFKNYKTEILSHGPRRNERIKSHHYSVWYIFENVTKQANKGFTCPVGNGTLKAIAFSKDEAIKTATNKNYYPKKFVEKPDEKPKDEPKKKNPKASPDDDKIVPAGSGSGFFVSKDGNIITNFHVIEGCELNKVSYKGNQSEAKVLSIDRVNDIAILQTDIKSENAFSVSNEDVSLLEDVVVAGYPLGKEISSAIKTHKGVVTALAGAGDNYSFFQTDAAINQGNSGGPIINQKGNVVGIAVATWVEEGVQGVHFGIKSSTLKTFANANGIKFLKPNINDLSNKELGQLIMKSTVYVECHMTVAKIKKMIADAENKKAFFKDVQ